MQQEVSIRRRLLVVGSGIAALSGCALVRRPHDDAADAAAAEPPLQRVGEWLEVRLPGKARTRYRRASKDGREAIEAHALRSASMLRRRLAPATLPPRALDFSWLVPELVVGASVTRGDSEDAPARVLLAFDGDHSRLSARNRVMFELAEALTGERPPYATLMYVWDREAPVGSLVVNARTDRIRKIVVDSGDAYLGRWRDHQRDIAADFARAYGEAPGPLQSVALMTDADNTGGSARAWYGPVKLR